MKILRIGCMLVGFLSLVLSLSAQTFNSLHSFDLTDGAFPAAPLVQATNGDLYGTTSGGGANCGLDGCGTVFKITAGGKLTRLYSFCSQPNCTDGYYPYAGLIQATDGNFYGTTEWGGANSGPDGPGTVFKITPSGKLTTLYSFCSQGGSNCTDGQYVYAGLIQATDGDFYGTTAGGGAYGGGTVFKITPSGKLTTLYSFCSQGGSNCTDGRNPTAGLVQATDGDLYGTTYNGGANGTNCEANYEPYGCGTVFKITAGGNLTTLYTFCSQGGNNCPDGVEPAAGLVQGTNGDLYGAASAGGSNVANCEANSEPYGCGTVFKVTPSGKLTTLHSFDGTDGATPVAALIQATDGNFYGTASGGWPNGAGTVFKITPSGKLTTLHSFDGTDGAAPVAALVQATNGHFYGTTYYGGANSDCPIKIHYLIPCGTVFSLSVGLGPFVETNPTSGKVGTAVKILGTDLTGATSVTFNGTAAVFKVVSASLIKTSVPEGATTGTVEVTTPKGTLKSNVVFRVTK